MPQTKLRESPKARVKAMLDSLPDNCSIEEVQYRLYVMETIGKRLDRVEKGQFLSQAEVEKRMRRWLSK